ncbi:MAG TPA: hypothetical protein VNT55_07890, partial [Baekduia sp.]|nr:hypothetical protein [Baekduia sp.]
GDVVTARIGAVRGARASAAYLRIDHRSAAPAFGDLAARLGASARGARQAADEVARLAETAGGPSRASPDPGPLRLFLLQARASLNLLIADLRDQAAGMAKVAGDVATLPRAERLAGQLRDAAGDARGAAARLEDGVTGLDEFINSIGGTSAAPLPAGTVSTIGAVLTAALQILDGLDPDDGIPGGPALPDPLGGVPVPPVPPVLP